MSHEMLQAARLLCAVHNVEVYRLKSATHDHVYLHTNLPNPCSGNSRGLALHVVCDRGSGQAWAEANFPNVELHVYDSSVGWATGRNPSRRQQVQDVDGLLQAV